MANRFATSLHNQALAGPIFDNITRMVLESMENNPRLLLVKLSAMGDVIHTIPALKAVKRAVPQIEIDWVVSDSFEELVKLSPHVGRVFAFHRKSWAKWWRWTTIKEVWRFIKQIRAQKYGAVLDLQGLLRSGLVTFAARSKSKVGFEYAREGAPIFYNRKIGKKDGDIHAIDRYMHALGSVGIHHEPPIVYDIEIPDAELEWANGKTPEPPYLVINPNSKWETKRWAPEKFAELAKMIFVEEGLKSVIIGAEDDKERGATIARLGGEAVVDLTGAGGLVKLGAILKGSVGMITNDSGPMHLAVALGVPTLAIFGPTNPKLTGPHGPDHSVVKHDVFCMPCMKRTCPYEHECMERLNPLEVITAWRGMQIKQAFDMD